MWQVLISYLFSFHYACYILAEGDSLAPCVASGWIKSSVASVRPLSGLVQPVSSLSGGSAPGSPLNRICFFDDRFCFAPVG